MQISKERCNTFNERTIDKVVNKNVGDYINKLSKTLFTPDFIKSLNPRIAKKVTNLRSTVSKMPIGTVVKLSNGEQFQRVSSRETHSKSYLWKKLNDMSNTETLVTNHYINRKNPVVIK